MVIQRPEKPGIQETEERKENSTALSFRTEEPRRGIRAGVQDKCLSGENVSSSALLLCQSSGTGQHPLTLVRADFPYSDVFWEHLNNTPKSYLNSIWPALYSIHLTQKIDLQTDKAKTTPEAKSTPGASCPPSGVLACVCPEHLSSSTHLLSVIANIWRTFLS